MKIQNVSGVLSYAQVWIVGTCIAKNKIKNTNFVFCQKQN